MKAITFPREPARRSAPRVESWWGRAFLRVAEETAYDDAQLAAARALARSGRVGGLVVEVGRFAAAVEDESGLWTVSGSIPVLDSDDRAALIEVLGAAPGRLGAVLAGDLPAAVAEHAEEAGVELVPETVSATCTCGHWHPVCAHGLGVLIRLGWLLDRDAGVLLHLRGLPREALPPLVEPAGPDPLAEAHRSTAVPVDDLAVALEAALRASRLLEE